MDDMEKHLYILLSKESSGEANDSEREELNSILNNFPEIRYAFDLLQNLKTETTDITDDEKKRKKRGLDLIEEMLRKEDNK